MTRIKVGLVLAAGTATVLLAATGQLVPALVLLGLWIATYAGRSSTLWRSVGRHWDQPADETEEQ